MIGEFSFYGIFFPWLLVLVLLALFTARLISYGLAQKGYYRHIWHPPLFDFALFFIVLGCYYSLLVGKL